MSETPALLRCPECDVAYAPVADIDAKALSRQLYAIPTHSEEDARVLIDAADLVLAQSSEISRLRSELEAAQAIPERWRAVAEVARALHAAETDAYERAAKVADTGCVGTTGTVRLQAEWVARSIRALTRKL